MISHDSEGWLGSAEQFFCPTWCQQRLLSFRSSVQLRWLALVVGGCWSWLSAGSSVGAVNLTILFSMWYLHVAWTAGLQQGAFPRCEPGSCKSKAQSREFYGITFAEFSSSKQVTGQSIFEIDCLWERASLVVQSVKNLLAMQETGVRFLGQKDPLEKEMATHSSILAWRIPWTEEPGRLQSIGSKELDTT